MTSSNNSNLNELLKLTGLPPVNESTVQTKNSNGNIELKELIVNEKMNIFKQTDQHNPNLKSSEFSNLNQD